MNGKKAKMLRRLAEEMSVGIPQVKYTDRALNPRKPTRRTRMLYECGRLVYRNLKTRYREGFAR